MFEEHPETGEWVGAGASLYAMPPDVFFDLFGGQSGGEPELAAQATDGEAFYQIEPLRRIQKPPSQPPIQDTTAMLSGCNPIYS